MVDVQLIGVLVTATSVTVAVVFYILNLRETNRNRKATLTTNLMQSFYSEDGANRYLELMSMEWKDFDDFMSKYDSRVNPGNWIKRKTFWTSCDLLGYQCRIGLIDLGTLYNVGGDWIISCWEKFGPIIEYRKRDYTSDLYGNLEYIAGVLVKVQARARRLS